MELLDRGLAERPHPRPGEQLYESGTFGAAADGFCDGFVDRRDTEEADPSTVTGVRAFLAAMFDENGKPHTVR